MIELNKLESHLWNAANILRGPVDAADFKTYIFPLLIFKRISDVYDEEIDTALRESEGDMVFALFLENHGFQGPEDCHWNDVRAKSANIGHALQQAMRGIEQANPDTLHSNFGDAQWTNKDRLSDALLKDLIEHFSKLSLGNENCRADVIGQAYEFLIKKFADDSGQTAAEFYTNRTVVHLMTEILEPEPGESIYDPTCGSVGMLLSAVAHLKRQKREWRNLGLYGQERNLLTSAIGRMNLLLHGIEDTEIRGRIDAIFVDEDRTFHIVDWKTGRPYESYRTRLQLPLYALAANRLWGIEPENMRLAYVFTHDGSIVAVDNETGFLERAEKRVLDAVERIRSGSFAPIPSRYGCSHCPVMGVGITGCPTEVPAE